MGVKYECKKCDKVFTSKSDYTRHTERKNPCDENKDIKIFINDQVPNVDVSTQILNKINEIIEGNEQMMNIMSEIIQEHKQIVKENKQIVKENKQITIEMKSLKERINKFEDEKKNIKQIEDKETNILNIKPRIIIGK